VIEPKNKDSVAVEPEVERNEPEGDRTQVQGESRYGEVYVRRKKQNKEAVPTVTLMPSPLRHIHHPPQTQNTQMIWFISLLSLPYR
jgi:formylmethanofuran dehydrogenase subunit D